VAALSRAGWAWLAVPFLTPAWLAVPFLTPAARLSRTTTPVPGHVAVRRVGMLLILVGWLGGCCRGFAAGRAGTRRLVLIVISRYTPRSVASTFRVAWTVVAICAAAVSTSALELAAMLHAPLHLRPPG